MNYQRFYRQLFAPLEVQIAPLDPTTIFAIIGFDCGGPLSFSTIGAERGDCITTYISCELAVRKEQVPSKLGRYELLCSCNNEKWVRRHITNLGRLSLETELGHGHTVDLGETVGAKAPLQGVVLEKQSSTTIYKRKYGIIRVIGLTRAEMDYKRVHGFPALKRLLKQGGVYPHTLVRRKSVV